MSLESMAEAANLTVRLNGEPRRVVAGVSVAALLRDSGIDPAKVAVERNLQIVARSTLDEVQVADGDVFEIVHFVGGG